MIPKTNLYKSSKVAPAHSRADVEMLLEKFGVKKFGWKRDDPAMSYVMFQRVEEFSGEHREITYKVTIPFIEKKVGRYGSKEFDETRSMRILYHVLKHQLLNTDVGMEFEQVFGNYIVVGQLKDGTPVSVQDKIGESIIKNGLPALEITENA